MSYHLRIKCSQPAENAHYMLTNIKLLSSLKYFHFPTAFRVISSFPHILYPSPALLSHSLSSEKPYSPMLIPWTHPAPSCLGGGVGFAHARPSYRAFPCLTVGKPLLFLPHSAYTSSPQRGLPWSDRWRRALVLVLVMGPASFTALVTRSTYYLLADLSNASIPPQVVCLFHLSQGLEWKLKLNEKTGGLGRQVFLWDWRKWNKEWSPRAILRWRGILL